MAGKKVKIRKGGKEAGKGGKLNAKNPAKKHDGAKLFRKTTIK